jgi:predicted CopG family antitoxin
MSLRKDVYERLKARKRKDESFTDLIKETSVDWRETFGSLSTEEANELGRVAAQSRKTTGRGLSDRQERAFEGFSAGEGTDHDES